MATMRAIVFAARVGIFLVGRAEITLAFIGAAVLFLPRFVFLSIIMPRAMKVDEVAAIGEFVKNEQSERVFWTVFVAMAGSQLVRVVDQSESAAGSRDNYRDGWMTWWEFFPPVFPVLFVIGGAFCVCIHLWKLQILFLENNSYYQPPHDPLQSKILVIIR
ncbi:MAG: hypothetical protein Q7T80_16465 [Methanoregula sp.]|nr:hypothetical protein [Methanoregula sp.]